MQRSKLDEVYSLSGKITRKEMLDMLKGDEAINQKLILSLYAYVNPFTGKVKDEYVYRRTNCPLCDSADFRFLFIKHGFDHVLCEKCELIFTLQILDNTKIGHLEEGDEGDNYGKYKSLPSVSDLDKKKFDIVFDELCKYTNIKRIFDFGSQVGTFLDWAKEKNFDIVGHEYHTPLRKIAIQKGHSVLNDELEKIQFDEMFDVITCWDYLDHVLNPKDVVNNLSKYLKKGGLFFFSINNRDSLSVKMMHESSPIFIGPHHTMHYGINQLKLLMNSYKLIHSESYVSELNWLSNWLSFKNPETGDAKLETNLLNSEKICQLGMGFKVNAVFQKL